MSWGLAWKRPSDAFHLCLYYGTDETLYDQNRPHLSSESSHISSDHELGFRIDLDWNAGEGDLQVALRLQSHVMIALPLPQDTVMINLSPKCDDDGDDDDDDDSRLVCLRMTVVKQRDPLRAVVMSRVGWSGPHYDGMGVFTKLMKSDFPSESASGTPHAVGVVRSCGDHWMNVTVVSVCSCGLSTFPVELTKLPLLEKLYLDHNKLINLRPEVGDLKNLKVLTVDYNMLVSVPVELRRCVGLVELSLEHNKLVCPLLDFRAMAELRVLRLFGNPLEFLPEILPLHQLRHLSLANIRIVADDYLRSVNVQIEIENSSYFVASRHKLSAFFALIFRYSSCHHPLLASALAKMMQDEGNRVVIGKDENAIRQLISMISSENHHVVEQACSALTSLASDVCMSLQLMKCDIMQPIQRVFKSDGPQELKSVLQVVATLGFVSDIVSQRMMNKDVIKSLKLLCAHRDPEVQRSALLAIGNIAFCLENRRILVASESLRDLLLRRTVASELRVRKAAARALAILGENESLRRSIKGRQAAKQGLRILTMDGGGMKGLATVQILKEIEKGTGKQIHEMFDLICGTSTGGMLAVALGIKLMSLEKCEDIYKNLGKLVFAEPVRKENEAATWREKFDQLYKSSSQNFRVVVHGSKHSADEFERLLKEICAEEDGDLLIDTAVKGIPKVIVVSTLINVAPAQPFIFRNYQYPAGTLDAPLTVTENIANSGSEKSINGAQIEYKRGSYMGSCRHHIWQAIRASSAAPYYLDDFSDGVFRWQDGAIVANNPTIFAIREAQLLWPDAKIDTLVSVGCCSVPTKVRKGGWRYLDTGQVLVESACSIERVEDMLSTLLSMIPEIQYFRFNPVDERCDMELDETDPTIWLKLEAATNDYIKNNSPAFKKVCEKLLQNHNDEKLPDILHSPQFKAKRPNTALSENGPSLGWRRSVLLVRASSCPDSRKYSNHIQSLETFCSNNGIRISPVEATSGKLKPVPETSFLSPFTSPLSNGSFLSSPYSSDTRTHRTHRRDFLPYLSLDGNFTAKSFSPLESPTALRQLSVPIRLLHEKLQNSPQVGVVHLDLENDSDGSILSWQNDIFVVAEPGELAEKFLKDVKYSFQSMLRGRGRRCKSDISNISSVADLVTSKPCFQIGAVVHRYIGRQTQVNEDNQEIGAYMFRRTIPSMHLVPADVRWMVGAWRDRIIIYTGLYGPFPALIKAFLDSGAKAVICASTEPHETQLTSFYGSCDLSELDNSKFEIGEEVEDEDGVTMSPKSEWEDMTERDTPGMDGETIIWDDEDEEELSKFICQIYNSIHLEGDRVDFALQRALASHRTMRYSCHLPRML